MLSSTVYLYSYPYSNYIHIQTSLCEQCFWLNCCPLRVFSFIHSGVEASAVASNQNGAPQPDLHRALSLLSNSWAGGGTGTGTDQHPTAQLRHAALSSSLAASSVSVAQASPAGLWQDGGAALGHHDYAHAFQAINTPGGGGAAAPIAVGQELLQLPRPPSLYDDGSSSRYDLMR